MAVTDDGIPETDLTEHDGLCEEKAVVAIAVIEQEADDACEWNHWRTSPNYTCFRTTDKQWLMQVGRNDPVVSVLAIESGYEATAVFTNEKGILSGITNIGRNPKESLVDLWERRDEDWVITRKFDYNELSFEDIVGSAMRQAAWGTQAEDSKGDA